MPSLEDFPGGRPGAFNPPDLRLACFCNHCANRLPARVPPSVFVEPRWSRNVNRVSISYAIRPRLRPRLTLSGLTFLRNPWTFGDQGSHLVYRYLCWQSRFLALQPCSRSAFAAQGMLSYRLSCPDLSQFRPQATARPGSRELRCLPRNSFGTNPVRKDP
jgi:hypothetical protein